MADDSKFTFDSKYLSAGLAALGVVALAAAGFVTITTPGEEECKQELVDVRFELRTELTEVKIQRADAAARLELLTEAKDACKTALEALMENDR